MEKYTREELESMVEWQHDRISELTEKNEALEAICDACLTGDYRLEQAYTELFPEDQPEEETLEYRLRKRAEIRRQIATRKSVQEGAPDRISDLLEEAAAFVATVREKM
jgi:predicted nuclease with TOPRIM domain